MSDRDASLLVAELRSLLRTRDERLTAIEHDLNNEVGTLQLSAGEKSDLLAFLLAL